VKRRAIAISSMQAVILPVRKIGETAYGSPRRSNRTIHPILGKIFGTNGSRIARRQVKDRLLRKPGVLLALRDRRFRDRGSRKSLLGYFCWNCSRPIGGELSRFSADFSLSSLEFENQF